jgi:effector-binding domain-containing protein
MRKQIYLAITACLIFSLAGLSTSMGNPAFGQDKFSIKEIPAFSYVCLPCKGPISNFGDKIGELTQFLQMQNIAPMGPLIGVYYSDPNMTKPEDLMWEIGFPVMESNAQDPLRFKQWTFTTVLEGTYTGPYDKLAGIYAEMLAWLDANGYVQAGPIMEKYLSDPNSTRPEDYKTEIWIPCRKK